MWFLPKHELTKGTRWVLFVSIVTASYKAPGTINKWIIAVVSTITKNDGCLYCALLHACTV